ncbi:hypothetical protein IQ268_08950 [Oculatella sp. LEGE 06141]|uniref:WDGH domain-containing protein n=1 Tax=Oculatella sp. LEGE 06141 TaxID=1828648 RepID=UPI0018814CE0|nr:hypothetical protein [Oculatella sp. LEGE 06141]MBE9178686.1 hypothetical protein [Oculatella sp. LEGE 06141]
MTEQEFTGSLIIPCETGKVSDGYHTFDELYEHRCLLFLALMRSHPHQSWKSRKHHDGSVFEGWFIAGLILPSGAVTYHLPDRMWNLCRCHEVELAPEWDGHTSKDVIDRLTQWLGDDR